MRDKKFRFLEQLEDDLRDAAARERVAGEGKRSRGTSKTSSADGDHNWSRWIAAAVVVLVVAGGIGAYAQYRDKSYQSLANGSGIAHSAYASSGGAPGTTKWAAADGAIRSETNQLGVAQNSAAGSTGGVETAPVPAPTSDQFAAYSDISRTVAATSPPVGTQDLSKVVKNGVITVELPVGKFAETQSAVTDMAGAASGYVLSSTARGSGSGTFVLRIPATAFDRVMNDLNSLPGGKVLWQNSSSQDVTAQFVDSNAQLQILRAQKGATLRYLKNAGSLSQSIQFRNQAFQIQGEIDKLTGQLKFLKDQVALATITVNLRETGAPATHKPAPVTKPSLVRAWDRSVSGFLGVVSAVIVGLGFLIPLGILAALIGFPIMVLTRKRRGASSAS